MIVEVYSKSQSRRYYPILSKIFFKNQDVSDKDPRNMKFLVITVNYKINWFNINYSTYTLS